MREICCCTIYGFLLYLASHKVWILSTLNDEKAFQFAGLDPNKFEKHIRGPSRSPGAYKGGRLNYCNSKLLQVLLIVYKLSIFLALK